MASPRFMRSRSFKYARRTAGTLTINTAAWANVDTTLDLVLEAQTGDVIEYGVNWLWNSEGVNGAVDVATVVAAAVVNVFSQAGPEVGTNDGVMGWFGAPSTLGPTAGSIMYTLLAADVSGGSVTLRLRARVASAGTKTIYATATDPLQVWAKNLGPQQPF